MAQVEVVTVHLSPQAHDLRPYQRAGKSQILDLRKEESMFATVGDRIVVRGSHGGDHIRDCEVLEVRGQDGAPPYVVRWGDNGHEAILYPGSDAVIEHFEHASSG